MKKALVTGGGGFIGQAIVGQLVDQGVEVTIVGRHHYPEVERLGGRCLVGDIRDRPFMIQAVTGHDTVFHAAAKAGIWGRRADYFSINVTGTDNVIAACRENRVERLVYTSSPSVVFDGSDLAGVDETLPYSRNVHCAYAETKILAEKKVLAANAGSLKTTALRPHLVWGPGDTNLVPRLLRRGREGSLKIVGDGTNRVDISYIDNVAQAHLLAAANLEHAATAAGETFFISQGEPVVLWDWINTLFGRLGIPAVKKKVSFKTAYRAGWLLERLYSLAGLEKEPKMTRFMAEQLARSHWFAIDKARAVLSYTPTVSGALGLDRLVGSLRRETGAPRPDPAGKKGR
ncbi:MAG TPA: NAD-dependent epimerase/dehydratase family protein [Desulfobacteraceae bacterium]|nr:NAD-dependent epimerase/dehydratase family protein [Desulfobacteraceae bacterium]